MILYINKTMSLTFCNSCGGELYKAAKIINIYKHDKLDHVMLEELCNMSQKDLLKQTLYPLLEKLELPLCCRLILQTYVDITPDICN